MLIEDGPNLGRVDVALAPDGSAVVSWLALEGKEAVIRYRAVSPQGEPGRVSRLAFPEPVRMWRWQLSRWSSSILAETRAAPG